MYINFVKYFLSIFAMVSVSIAKVVYVVPIQGTIDLGLPPFIERVISTAENKIYVDNLKVMLAENLYKGNSFIILKEVN